METSKTLQELGILIMAGISEPLYSPAYLATWPHGLKVYTSLTFQPHVQR